MNVSLNKERKMAAGAAMRSVGTRATVAGFNLGDIDASFKTAPRSVGDRGYGSAGRQVVALKAYAPFDTLSDHASSRDSSGIFVELLEDVAILAVPMTKTGILPHISASKAAKLAACALDLGKRRCKEAAVAVASTAEYVAEDTPHLRELDINQWMVSPENHGVVSTRRRR